MPALPQPVMREVEAQRFSHVNASRYADYGVGGRSGIKTFMTTTQTDEPLDPAAARLIRNVRWLMAISVAATVIAIGVVIGIIGYRMSGVEGSTADATASLPKGARVISTAVSDGRIAVTMETAGIVEIRLFDLRTLKPAGRLRFTPEP